MNFADTYMIRSHSVIQRISTYMATHPALTLTGRSSGIIA